MLKVHVGRTNDEFGENSSQPSRRYPHSLDIIDVVCEAVS